MITRKSLNSEKIIYKSLILNNIYSLNCLLLLKVKFFTNPLYNKKIIPYFKSLLLKILFLI